MSEWTKRALAYEELLARAEVAEATVKRLQEAYLPGNWEKLQDIIKQRDDYKFQMEANERSWHKAEDLWDAAEQKIKELSERIRELEEALGAPLAMVQAQANDKAIWLQAKTVPEACLQRELRRLHFAIESNAKYVSRQASHAPQCKNNGVRGFECSPECKRVPEDVDGYKGD